MTNYVTPTSASDAEQEFLTRFRTAAIEKLQAFQDAQIQFEGFSAAYKKRLRTYLSYRFTNKFGHDGWLKIESTAHEHLNGYYEITSDEPLIREAYSYGEVDSLKSLNLWVLLRKLETTASGHICANRPTTLISGDFLNCDDAYRCAKPAFKERTTKADKKGVEA